MNLSNITSAMLNQAADIKEKIEKLSKELSAVLGDFAHSVGETPKAKRKMSAKAKAMIGAAQKARWAKFHAAKKGASAVTKPAKAKRKISAAGIARIKAAQKARWAKVKAAKAA
jgi:hypothetical protein